MKIILVGPSCCGKDFLRAQLEDRGFQYCVTCTTRNPRENEENGIDYYFLNKDKFRSLIKNKQFIEYDFFNKNYYGTLKGDFYEKDLFIMTPKGVQQLPDDFRRKANVIFLDVDYDIQKERMREKRNMNEDEIEKRIEQDNYEFEKFDDFDYYFKNFNEDYIDQILNSLQC